MIKIEELKQKAQVFKINPSIKVFKEPLKIILSNGGEFSHCFKFLQEEGYTYTKRQVQYYINKIKDENN